MANNFIQRNYYDSTHTLLRAFNSPFPGIAFAYSASYKKEEPLADNWARLFVGLSPVKG